MKYTFIAFVCLACMACSLIRSGPIDNAETDKLYNADAGERRPVYKPFLWRTDPTCLETAPVKPGDDREKLASRCDQGSRNFVALAFSGGGTKAAVFSGETMFYLEALGLMSGVDVISSVSGGSFAAALYSVSCDPKDVGSSSENYACKEGITKSRGGFDLHAQYGFMIMS